jgi:hypothetical protein
MKKVLHVARILLLPLLLLSVGASPKPGECRISCTRSIISALVCACDIYVLDTGEYPAEEYGLSALMTNPGVENRDGPYIRSKDNALPTDAWGFEFRYRLIDGKPVIDSCGPDGIFGTDDGSAKNEIKPFPLDITSLKLGAFKTVVTSELARAGYTCRETWVGYDPHEVILPDAVISNGIESVRLEFAGGTLSKIKIEINHNIVDEERAAMLQQVWIHDRIEQIGQPFLMSEHGSCFF